MRTYLHGKPSTFLNKTLDSCCFLYNKIKNGREALPAYIDKARNRPETQRAASGKGKTESGASINKALCKDKRFAGGY